MPTEGSAAQQSHILSAPQGLTRAVQIGSERINCATFHYGSTKLFPCNETPHSTSKQSSEVVGGLEVVLRAVTINGAKSCAKVEAWNGDLKTV